jgi:hypothetical protein
MVQQTMRFPSAPPSNVASCGILGSLTSDCRAMDVGIMRLPMYDGFELK